MKPKNNVFASRLSDGRTVKRCLLYKHTNMVNELITMHPSFPVVENTQVQIRSLISPAKCYVMFCSAFQLIYFL